jgi:hypothetical protein
MAAEQRAAECPLIRSLSGQHMLNKYSANLTEPFQPQRVVCPAGYSLEMSVLMSVIAVSAAGVAIGLRYKAPTLLAATAALLAGSFAWNGLGFPGYVNVADFLILAFALACAYLVGLALSVRSKRNES